MLVCVRVCVRACVCVCVYACVRVCVYAMDGGEVVDGEGCRRITHFSNCLRFTHAPLQAATLPPTH